MAGRGVLWSFGPRGLALLRTFRRHQSGVAAALAVAAIFAGVALAPWIAPHDPLEVDVSRRLSPPDRRHLFGTDEIGRDLLSRVLHGGRISVVVGIAVPLVAAVIGSVLGMVSGYKGGVVDDILMRFSDVMLAFPALLLALAIVAALGANVLNAMIAIVVTWIPVYARLARGQAMAIKGEDYVQAAVAVGASRVRVLRRHIFPNCLAPVVVKITLDIGRAVRYLATLSFLGLGASPPSPEWGALVAAGRLYLDCWWLPIIPGLAIYVTSLSLSLLGDAISDILNPRLRGQ